MNAALAGGGAIGSRWLTQLALGSSNTGLMGYGGNAVATLVLAWGAGKFLGKGTRNWVLVGGVLGILLRAVQDFTPWGKSLSLSGMGDSGMGILMPSAFVDPPLFTGNGAQRRIPPAWQASPVAAGNPAAPAKAGGMGYSSYGVSTYR